MWYLIIGTLVQFTDIVFGVGFGTIMTPLLLSFNFPVYETICTLLLLQSISGLIAGLTHQLHGTIDWSLDKNLKPTGLMIVFGIIGASISAFIAVNINIIILEIIISLLVISTGTLFFIRISDRRKQSPKKLLLFSLIASFAKVISGVYGPIITSGQVLSGYNPKKSVARTAFTEGLVSLTGFLVFIFYASINWFLFISLALMMLVVIPLSTYLVKISDKTNLRKGIGVFIIFIGLTLFIKVLV